jgi:hypothetical protein
MRRINADDDDDFDEEGILKDGRSLRVPLTMADSWQRDMVRSLSRVTDASGNAGAFHRPGFRVVDAAASDAKETAYAEYDSRVANAWRDADNDRGISGFGVSELRGLEIGSSCTVKEGGGKFGAEDSRGTVQLVEGVKRCVADDRRADAAIQDGREAAYADYDDRVANAWRNP